MLRPTLALISVGADNDYGHPAESALRPLAQADVYRTDRDGDLAVVAGADGPRVVTSD